MNNSFHRAFSPIALITALGLWTAAPLYAQDVWVANPPTHTGSTNWSFAPNWSAGVPVQATNQFTLDGTNLVFTGAFKTTNVNDIGLTFGFGSLTFDAAASAFTLTGNATGFNGGITNNSAFAQTISLQTPQGIVSGVGVFNNQTWNAATADLNIFCNVDTGGLTGGTLTITGAHDTTITGVIFENAGNLLPIIKTGTGTLFLTNNNTWTGGLTEFNGVVDVGAQFSLGAGNTTIVAGLLRTTGQLPLIFNVGNNFTMVGGFPLAILQMKVGGLTPGFSADFLHVGNVMNLSGELFVHKIFNYLPAPGDQVTIITSGGARNGTFQFVTSDFPGLIQPIAVYFPQRVDVRFVLNPFTSLPDLCFNEFSVAEALDRAFAGACLPLSTFTFLGNEPIADLPRDFQLIAPEELAAMYEIKFSQATVENSNLMRRMDDIRAGSNGFCAAGYVPPPAPTYSKEAGGKEKNPAPAWVPSPENRWGIFITGGGDFVHVGNNDECAAGYDLRIGDLTVGADYRILPNVAIGIYGGYDGADADLAADGRLDMASGKGGGFITAFWHGFYADAAGGGGWDNYEIHRRALSPRGILGLTQGAFANGSTDGDEVNAMGALGYDWKHDFGKPGCIVLGPLLSVQYTNVNINGYTEHGSLIPLEIPDQSDDSLRLTAGGRVSMDIPSEHGVIFRPEARASWLHEFNDRGYPIEARFVGCPDLFTVRGPEVGRDAALVGAGVTIQVTPTFSVFGHYDGIVSRHNYNSYAVNGGLGFSF